MRFAQGCLTGYMVHVYQKRDGRLLGVSEKRANATYRAPDCIAMSIHGNPSF